MDQFSSSHDPDAEKRILGSWHRSVHGACLDCKTWGGVLAIESSHITTWVVCLQPRRRMKHQTDVSYPQPRSDGICASHGVLNGAFQLQFQLQP